PDVPQVVRADHEHLRAARERQESALPGARPEGPRQRRGPAGLRRGGPGPRPAAGLARARVEAELGQAARGGPDPGLTGRPDPVAPAHPPPIPPPAVSAVMSAKRDSVELNGSRAGGWAWRCGRGARVRGPGKARAGRRPTRQWRPGWRGGRVPPPLASSPRLP